MTNIRSFLRGLESDNKPFYDCIKVIDEIMIDMCPLYDTFGDKYNNMFIVQ